jgi:hypothetical protein
MRGDLEDLREGFKQAIAKLPDYKRAMAWEYVNALNAEGGRLKVELQAASEKLLTQYNVIATLADNAKDKL